MKKTFAQIHGNWLKPAGPESIEVIKNFKPNQFVRIQIYGTNKERSIRQNNWIHWIFDFVSKNTDDPEWDTPAKVKIMVKLAMKHFSVDKKTGEMIVIVQGNKVMFQLASFAFDEMEQNEANIKYEEAKLICAKKIGVNPDELEANAKLNTQYRG